LDGNGRVARLATHAALYRDFTSGLWSVCRGLARTQQEYYARLASADSPRRGDLDGRGNLAEEGLWQFCHYFLNVCLDQVNFMEKMLDFDDMRKRIRALLIFKSEMDKQIRREAELPLHYLFSSGPLTRAEFKQMTGLGDKVAQMLLSKLLKVGLVESDTPLGPVRFGLPLEALAFYFPDLYPEAAVRIESK
jgi:Fic family protein